MNKLRHPTRRQLVTRTVAVGTLLAIGSGLARADDLDDAVDAAKRLAREAYRDDISGFSSEGRSELATVIVQAGRKIVQSGDNLKEHLLVTWSSSSSSGTYEHIQRCPYCYKVADYCYENVAGLTPVVSRIPNQFLINGVYYIASGWGGLHRAGGGPEEGFIWFNNGQYVGVSHVTGIAFHAEPMN